MPLYALGGVTAERVASLGMPGGADGADGAVRPAGVAVIGAVFGADDPVAAALKLARAVGRALRS